MTDGPEARLEPRPYLQWLVALSVCMLGFALGARSLNEPDEGRYSQIASTMVETGDWLVPQLWYAPHLDKPPLTYWAVAASIRCFGRSEWAIRLPLALAGLSGILATYALGARLGGARAGFWAGLILLSSLLYFAMARMLTTDIFLCQFLAWTAYAIWRGHEEWTGDDKAPGSGVAWKWALLGGAMLGLAFLTKGPIAMVIPAAGVVALVWRARRRGWSRPLPWGRLGVGTLVCAAIAAPWFLLLFRRLPEAFDYMVFGQALGHALGTYVKDRRGHPLYYVAILGAGLLPWTALLGWLWRRQHWRSLAPRAQEAWLFLSVWAAFTIGFFTLSASKLPAYILPAFPALAVLLAVRWFGSPTREAPATAPVPPWGWRVGLGVAAFVLPVAPAVVLLVFHANQPAWFGVHAGIGVLVAIWLAVRWRTLSPASCARWTAGLALAHWCLVSVGIGVLENDLSSNQTLKPIGVALRQGYSPGDAVVVWGRFPQGLPFYAYPALNATNRPHMGDLNTNKVPFQSVGNAARFAPLYLKDDATFLRLLHEPRRVWVVTHRGSFDRMMAAGELAPPARMMCTCGRVELFVTR